MSLGKLKLSSDEVLKRDQLSTIYGGSDDIPPCHYVIYCASGSTVGPIYGCCGTAPGTFCDDYGGVINCVNSPCY
ncbi:hypothetical protein [Algoriphagus pacificus]|uniref:Bacteriocin-type signal sequence-containing protein n=1 Tax=Algoriphagus pacificus TaxID=2811234 RepID=A0ABS3CCA8_9BACT|nr:hypothetical protein [Algoriphagus pacificus]MBN7814698.1 hypothetical protein [Algoriphagus pacificus]